jgi:S1-C subfamily serine protease
VVEGSPAAIVGLQRGDVITTINGRKASEFTLEEVRGMFLQEGREFTLEILRGGKTIQVNFRTRRLI